MANSFNISVKPEIAAAVVKIDSIKADTGPIRNDVTAIHDTDLPSVKNDTGPVRNDVTALHDTMIPSLMLDTGAIRNDMTDIHDTDLPLVKIDTGAIRNDVDDCKVGIAAIPTDQLFSVDLSDVEIAAANTDKATTTTSYIKCKEIEVFIPGTYRITFEMASGGAAIDAYAKIYKNGVAYGTERINDTQSYVLYSEDLAFTFGDLIQLYHYTSNGSYPVHSRTFKVKGVKSVSISNVIID